LRIPWFDVIAERLRIGWRKIKGAFRFIVNRGARLSLGRAMKINPQRSEAYAVS
jgi:hypothetical protein